MSKLVVGMKIYSYCFGPMTVQTVNDSYITASVDMPNEMSKAMAEKCRQQGVDINAIKLTVASFGHWYFEDPKDVQNERENNDFAEADKQGGFPRALTREPALLHKYFIGEIETGSEVGLKKGSGTSSEVGLLIHENNGKSPVGVR